MYVKPKLYLRPHNIPTGYTLLTTHNQYLLSQNVYSIR